MNELQKQFKEQFPEGLIEEPLKMYSTFFIGGPADFFYAIKDSNDIPRLINFANENNIPFIIIGKGSNILFDDEGFRGLVIRFETDNIEVNGMEITADAGVSIARLVDTATQNNLSGFENWGGLPGTVGGSVRGNAGCHGVEVKDVLKSALIFDPETGKIEKKDNSYFNFGYRYSKLKESKELVIKATFSLNKVTDIEEFKRKLQESQQFRMQNQPFGLTTGSFFKNPSPDKSAGMLIDQCGLKGKTIGKAQISDKHANFFLNMGGATFKEMIELVKLAKNKVKEDFGIDLVEEVQIIGPYGKEKI